MSLGLDVFREEDDQLEMKVSIIMVLITGFRLLFCSIIEAQFWLVRSFTPRIRAAFTTFIGRRSRFVPEMDGEVAPLEFRSCTAREGRRESRNTLF
jgi:hypothetical protein